MAEQLYDYSKYYKTMTANANIKIDTSGIDLKAAAYTSDEDGNEISLTEAVTNNVRYYISDIRYCTLDSDTYVSIKDPKASLLTDDNKYVKITKTVYDSEGQSTDTAIYIRIGYPVDTLIEHEIVAPNEYVETRLHDEITPVEGDRANMVPRILVDIYEQDVSDEPSRLNNRCVIPYEKLKAIQVYYVPRYAMMTAAGSRPAFDYVTTDDSDYKDTEQDQNYTYQTAVSNYTVAKMALYALGYARKREAGFKWIRKHMLADSAATVKYSAFSKILKYINGYMNDTGYGVSTTYYDTNYWDSSVAESVADATKQDYRERYAWAVKQHAAYERAQKAADYTRTEMTDRTKYSEIGEHLSKFLEKQNDRDIIDDISGIQENYGTGSALVPNVCDAFKSFYYDADELRTDFNMAFSTVMDNLFNLPIIGKVMKNLGSKNRKRLKTLRNGMLATHNDGDTPKYLLDVNELRYSLYQVYHECNDGEKNYKDDFGIVHCRAIPQWGYDVLVTGNSGTSAAGSIVTGMIKKVDRSYGAKPDLDKDSKLYKSSSTYLYDRVSRGLGNSEVTDYSTKVSSLIEKNNVSYTDYTASQLENMLTEWYNEWYITVNEDFEGFEWYIVDRTGNSYITGIRRTVAMDEDADTTVYDGPADNDTRYRYYSVDEMAERGVYRTSPGYMGLTGYNLDVPESDLDDLLTMTDIPNRGSATYNRAQNEIHIDSLSAFLDECGTLLNRLTNYDGTSDRTFDLLPDGDGNVCILEDKSYHVINWDDYTWNKADDELPNYKTPAYSSFMPAYMVDSTIDGKEYDMNFIVSKVIEGSFPAALSLARIYAAANFKSNETYGDVMTSIETMANSLSELDTITDRIKYYQLFTHESIFSNTNMVWFSGYDAMPNIDYKQVPARFMVPVHMYKKVRKKYKTFGFTRHKTVKKSIGVRWVDVRFVDTTIYGEYPQVESTPCNIIPIDSRARFTQYTDHVDIYIANTDASLFTDVEKNTKCILVFGNPSTRADELIYLNVQYVDENNLVSYDVDAFEICPDNGSRHALQLRVPLAKSKDDDARHEVQIVYNMPSLPYPDEIRKKSFIDFGPFDQSVNAVPSRSGENFKGHVDSATGQFVFDRDSDGNLVPLVDRVDGMKVFRPSSSEIKDLRDGLGVHHAVAMLVAILKNEFGAHRVTLCETMRSKEDEAIQCTGSSESEFLSWHNYGLAAKILITKEDNNHETIEEGSDDMWKLIDIAESFTEACRKGLVCPKPLNVVWCGRLVMGANNFVWEFLPIGVEHKDAPKFRESILAQGDPVVEYGYIDVDSAGYVVDSIPEEGYGKPYISRHSSAYRNAILIDGAHYVSPSDLYNYRKPTNLPLIDIIEYIKMIELKMEVNGTTLTDRANIYDWKALSDTAFNQLVTFFGVIGNTGAVQTLLGGDYVEHYQNTVDMLFETSHVDFVKEFLGDEYYNVKIFVQNVGNGGSYIMLHDGKLHIKVNNLRSVYDERYDQNFFGSRQTDLSSMERGLYIDGVFRNDEYLESHGITTEYVSEEPVISGYAVDRDGSVYVDMSEGGGDALLLHSLITTQLKNYYDDLKARFEGYQGKLLYDRFDDGPNAGMREMLENEFGVIAAQDLMSFDRLRTMYEKDAINGTSGGSNAGGNNAGANEEDGGFLNSDGNGNRYDSIYEKVVSNALLSGVRKASLTKEHVEVNARNGGLSVEDMYRMLTQGKKITAKDMFR